MVSPTKNVHYTKSVGYKEKKKDKSIFQLICPMWLPNLDLNQGPSD